MSAPNTSDIIDQVVLGRYRVVRQLAQGGMGTVYLGRTEGAEGFARPVVIKRIQPWLTQELGIAQMFVREARILSNLQHPNIVGVLDFGQQDDGSYIMVLDYVHGFELSEWLNYTSLARGRLPVEHAVHIICKVLDALHYAHTLKRADGKPLGIVHRDVTPTNVFLSDHGVVKLLDFGIALVIDEERKFTGRNEVRGKLPYIPAEVCGGAPPTAAGDVYSSGVMLYELLTGTNPFDAPQTATIFSKILTFDPKPVSTIRDDAPEALDAVVARAMSRDLETRFKSAAELAQALRALPLRSDDAVVAELAEQLRQDFELMPGKLGVLSLPERERAWRGAGSSRVVAGKAPEPLGHRERSPDDATRSAEVPAAVIDQSRRSAAPPKAAEPPAGPAPRPALSLSRLLLVAAIAGGCGAIAVLLTWLILARDPPVQERMVVISKESAAPSGTAPSEPPSPGAAHEDPAQTVTAAEEVGSAQAEAQVEETHAKSPVARSAAEPDAEALSRTFARKQRLVHGCFTKHAGGEPNLPQVSIHFTVGQSGAVSSARIDPESLAARPLGRCLLDVARQTRFGPLQRKVSFRIPISAEKVLQSSL